jgi:IS1 family transposase
VQCDEIWSFIGCKQNHLKPEERGNTDRGDVWTWTALDADSKLMICWSVGPRDAETACEFVADLQSRLAERVQLTTDGMKLYVNAAEEAFGGDVDYAMLVKLYGEENKGEKRYSPAECIGAEKTVIQGNPDKKHISTSFVERQNLTMRMCMRRFTRLTNAFSKKLENHAAAVALHFMYYNFARPHQTLRKPYPKTPAMAAGVADHVWSIEQIVGLLESN